MSRRGAAWVVWFMLLVVWLVSVAAVAQTTDTAILGTVSDSSGGAVVGAQIEISQPATGLDRKSVV